MGIAIINYKTIGVKKLADGSGKLYPYSEELKKELKDKENARHFWSAKYQSERSKNVFYTVVCVDGEFSCNCFSFRYNGYCKHIAMAEWDHVD